MHRPPLRIVVDANVPFAREAFGAFGEVVLVPGAEIDPAMVRTADVLVVRSVTPVGPPLLAGSAVRFVGTATIGTDHVDVDWLRAQGIAFAAALGSNAESVVEYVLAALLRMAVRHDRPLRGQTLGIVGAGNVGGRLLPRARALGLRVLVCDPPRARQEDGDFVSLDALLAASDIVSLHVPLVRDGADATWHLMDDGALARMQRGAWLINAARGEVLEGNALGRALESRHLEAAVLDVWQREPAPDPDLVARVAIATPHIAGYSFDGKVQGTRDIVQALEAWAGRPAAWDVGAALAPSAEDRLHLVAPDAELPEHYYLDALAQQLYPIEADDARMRRLLLMPPSAHAAYFRALRRDYPRRRRWGLYTMQGAVPQAYREAVTAGLGVRLA